MKFLLSISTGVAVMMVSFIILIHYAELNTVTVRYDCRMLIGGWHPDVPLEVQKKCKNLK